MNACVTFQKKKKKSNTSDLICTYILQDSEGILTSLMHNLECMRQKTDKITAHIT